MVTKAWPAHQQQRHLGRAIRPAAPTVPTQKALAIAREQQQSREAARGKKTACDPRCLVVYEYTPERLLIWLEKRSRIKLMMARWKYEP